MRFATPHQKRFDRRLCSSDRAINNRGARTICQHARAQRRFESDNKNATNTAHNHYSHSPMLSKPAAVSTVMLSPVPSGRLQKQFITESEQTNASTYLVIASCPVTGAGSKNVHSSVADAAGEMFSANNMLRNGAASARAVSLVRCNAPGGRTGDGDQHGDVVTRFRDNAREHWRRGGRRIRQLAIRAQSAA